MGRRCGGSGGGAVLRGAEGSVKLRWVLRLPMAGPGEGCRWHGRGKGGGARGCVMGVT